MIKFAALNATTEDSSDSTRQNKEVVESDAFQKYNKALVFIKNKEHDLAEKTLKELLLHPYFNFDEEAFSGTEFFNDPAVKLLTSINKNLGKIYEETENYDDALECYREAVSVDKTDITTWYNMANVAIEKVNYSLACDSLKECLKINPSYWPSIDTLICILYALGDYFSCLHLINHSLLLNTSFQRALCVKAQIEEEDPFLFKNFSWKQDLADLKPIEASSEKEMVFPKRLREKYQQAKNVSGLISKTDPVLHLRELCPKDPLADLGIAICELFLKSKEEDLSLFCPVNFSKSNLEELLKDQEEEEKKLEEDKENVIVNDDTPVATPIIQSTKDQESLEKVDSPVDSPATRETKEVKERREGYRRSKRVKDLQAENNDPSETLVSQLDNWIPEHLRGSSSYEPSKCITAKESGDQPVIRKPLPLSELELLKNIIDVDDSTVMLVPLMKTYCNQMSAAYDRKWSKTVTKAFLNVYFSYREYEALPNILQSFGEDDTEENVLTLLCAFELLVSNNITPGVVIEDQFFQDLKCYITKSALDKDQEFLRTANQHDRVKEMFSSSSSYDTFQLRYAWTHCLYEDKLGNIECSLEYIKLCIGKLEDAEVKELVLANNEVSFITLEALEKQKTHLIETQERESVALLFREKNYSRVVELLKPMLDHQDKDVQIEKGQIPLRQKNLLILLESLRKLSMMEDCLKCSELLLNELVPFLRVTDTCKSLLTKILKSLTASLAECDLKSMKINYSRVMSNVLKIITKFFDTWNKEETQFDSLFDYPIDRAFMIYHMLIDELVNDDLSEAEVLNSNVSRIQSLALCHELLGDHRICSLNNGVFLSYIIECCNRYKNKGIFIEDATDLIEQAIFCYIGHPGTGSKRSKKNRIEHGANNVTLTLEIAKSIYNFYVPLKMSGPMDKSKHIHADTFELLAKIVGLMDRDVSKSDPFLKIKLIMEQGAITTYEGLEPTQESQTFKDIFYLCGDYLLKYEEYLQAIDWFACDLALNPDRIESWLCLGLCWLSIAEDRFNHAQSDLKVVIESIAPKAVLCFDFYMSKEDTSFIIASEYSIFLYTIASVYNQVAGALSDNLEVIQQIDLKRLTLITKAKDVLLKGLEPTKPDNWVKCFMLGKINEKLNCKDLIWLDYYMEALDNLEDYKLALTRKINTSTPAEYSMECFELVFRIAYSIYKRSVEYPEMVSDSAKKDKMVSSLKKIMSLLQFEGDLSIANKSLGIPDIVRTIIDDCFAKWPEHYKMRNALCKMVHEAASSGSDEYSKAKSLMIQDASNGSGMFLFTRKHLFLGIWRIPVDTVDRPGGFFRHMRKSLSLILASLTHCKDISNLIKLFENMVKTADQLNTFVGDVTPFLHTTLTQFDALLRSRVSEYCSSPKKHTTEHSIKLLKLCIKIKSIHVKSGVETKPVDEAILVVLKLFKLTATQQLALYDPRALDDTKTLYDIANKLIDDFEQIQKVSALLELEKQKSQLEKPHDLAMSHSDQVIIPVQPLVAVSTSGQVSAAGSVSIIEEPSVSSEHLSGHSPESNTVVQNDKAVVNDAAKSAVRQAVASFITQMAEKNTKGSTNANVSQILNIINHSVNNKENSAKIREILLKAVNKQTDEPEVAGQLAPTVKAATETSDSHSGEQEVPTADSNPITQSSPPVPSLGSTYKLKSSSKIQVSPALLRDAIPRLQKTLSSLSKTTGALAKLNNIQHHPELKRTVYKTSMSTQHAALRQTSSEQLDQSETAISISQPSAPSFVSSEAPQASNHAPIVSGSAPQVSISALKISNSATQQHDHQIQEIVSPKVTEAIPPRSVQLVQLPRVVKMEPEFSPEENGMNKQVNTSPCSGSPTSLHLKRKRSSSPGLSASFSDDSDSDDEATMPSLDDVPALETVPSKNQRPDSEFRPLPNLNIAQIDGNGPVVNGNPISNLNPPMLVKKEPTSPLVSLGTTPYLQSPPPMYCPSGSGPQFNPVMKPEGILRDFPIQKLLHATESSRLALTPAQLMALNVPGTAKKATKGPRVKKERAPKKKKQKEEGVVKKREKKRKIDKIPTLKQFDFPLVEKGMENPGGFFPDNRMPDAHYGRSVSEVHGASGSQNNAFFRQSSEPVLSQRQHFGQPQLNRDNSDENIYKPEDFFAGSNPSHNGSPAKSGFLSDSSFNNNSAQGGMLMSPPPSSDQTMFSPGSSDNHTSSEQFMDDDSQLDNVDLGILNELDGCDLTEEQARLKHIGPDKGKRGRKPKDPNKPKAPTKRRKSKKAEQKNANDLFNNLPGAQFTSPPQNPHMFSYQKPEGAYPATTCTPDSPSKYFFYNPTQDPIFNQSNAAKMAMMPPSLQPHSAVPQPPTAVQQQPQMEMSQCSTMMAPPTPAQTSSLCQFSPEGAGYIQSTPSCTAPPLPLTHFSPEVANQAPKVTYGVQYNVPTSSFEQGMYSSTPNTLCNKEPLEQQQAGEAEQQTGGLHVGTVPGFGMQQPAQYPSPQTFNPEMFPTSMYPDHSFNPSVSPSANGQGLPPANNNSYQYHNFRTF